MELLSPASRKHDRRVAHFNDGRRTPGLYQFRQGGHAIQFPRIYLHDFAEYGRKAGNDRVPERIFDDHDPLCNRGRFVDMELDRAVATGKHAIVVSPIASALLGITPVKLNRAVLSGKDFVHFAGP